MVSKRTKQERKKRAEELKKAQEQARLKGVEFEKAERGRLTAEAFIDTIASLLGVSSKEGSDRRIGYERDAGFTYHQNILRSLTELKMEFAREDEASKIESEKASTLAALFRAALHDPSIQIEAGAKSKFLTLISENKDSRALMEVAHSYGVFPRYGGENTCGEYRPNFLR